MYRVFTRTWWKRNPSWPGGREPSSGRRYTIAKFPSYDEARNFCQAYNKNHDPGFLSRKAEFEEIS